MDLRDFGPIGVGDIAGDIFSLSPDGTSIAFQLRRADVSTNRYCLGIVVLSLKPGADPVVIDQGGEFIPVTYSVLGFAANTSPGTPVTVVPKWSSDGQWLTYLRRDANVTQVWRARADGSMAMPMTRSKFDVEDFAWGVDDNTIVYSGRPALIAAEVAIEAEGASGYLFDNRFQPVSRLKPFVREPVAMAYFAQDIQTGQMRAATEDERARLDVTPTLIPAEGARLITKSGHGDVAWVSSTDPDNVAAKTQLTIVRAAGRAVLCNRPQCEGIADMWWMPDDGSLVFIRREGWRAGETGIYRWREASDQPERILITQDALIGCQPLGNSLLCAHESAVQPRALVRIDLAKGRKTTLFDPNPEFAAVRLGAVERLQWINAYGIETFGQLVLPPDYKASETYPLIVVPYDARGFLRGGTGDEYPIQLFAAHGFAVLVFENPVSIAMTKGARSLDEINRINRKDAIDRRSIQSSIETGIDLATTRANIDPHRVGITGVSDGASSVLFGLINSKRFAAAAVSSCCHEASSSGFLAGPAIADWLQAMGYPSLTHPDEAFWAPLSLRQNAATISAPLLMQLADREFLTSLEGFTALHDQGKAVELYVFPNETHIKWQPAHRLAVYARALDWFSFWLQDHIDPDPDKTLQYQRWLDMRRKRDKDAPPGP